jgi:hypothetical protein
MREENEKQLLQNSTRNCHFDEKLKIGKNGYFFHYAGFI